MKSETSVRPAAHRHGRVHFPGNRTGGAAAAVMAYYIHDRCHKIRGWNDLWLRGKNAIWFIVPHRLFLNRNSWFGSSGMVLGCYFDASVYSRLGNVMLAKTTTANRVSA